MSQTALRRVVQSACRLSQVPGGLAGPSRLALTYVPRQPLSTTLSQRRGLLGKRMTSFYTHSFPPKTADEADQTPFVPSVPPGPARSAPNNDEGRQKEKKERYLDSLMDKAGELSLRCSIIDAEGNWNAEEGRYKKSELCKEHDLDPRDLRKLDSLAPNLVPLILTRKTCILISMLHIRALIKPDRVIIFNHAGTVESEIQKRFKWHLEKNVRAGYNAKHDAEDNEDEIGLAYEHRALESILVATANALEEEMVYTRQVVQQLLGDLEDDINRDNLKKLLHYSRRMVGFQSRARYVKRAVDELLDSDEDLSAMYLTSRARGKPRALHDHEQLEMLLESFQKQVEEIVSEVDTTVANMNSTQEITELMLDSGRNALLSLDISVSIITLGVTGGALVAGFFGMNLLSHLEENPHAFLIVSSTACGIALVTSLVGLKILRRVRRVALNAGGTGLRHFGPPPVALGYQGPPDWSTPLDNRQSWLGRWFWPRIPQGRTGAHVPPHVIRNMFRARLQAREQARAMAKRTAKSGGPSEPVWINEQADRARARDALRCEMLKLQEEGEDGTIGGKEPWNEWEKHWKGGKADWDSGPWKWGRGKPKWAKE